MGGGEGKKKKRKGKKKWFAVVANRKVEIEERGRGREGGRTMWQVVEDEEQDEQG